MMLFKPPEMLLNSFASLASQSHKEGKCLNVQYWGFQANPLTGK